MRKLYIGIDKNNQPMAMEVSPSQAVFTFEKIGEYPAEILEIDPALWRGIAGYHGLLMVAKTGPGHTSWKYKVSSADKEPGIRIISREEAKKQTVPQQ